MPRASMLLCALLASALLTSAFPIGAAQEGSAAATPQAGSAQAGGDEGREAESGAPAPSPTEAGRPASPQSTSDGEQPGTTPGGSSPPGEQAPPREGSAPSTAHGALLDVLQRERARLMEGRAAIQSYGESLTARRAESLREITEAENGAAALAAEFSLLGPDSQSVTPVYERIVTALESTGRNLEAALDEWNSPSGVPVLITAIDLGGLDAPAIAGEILALRTLRDDSAAIRARLVAIEDGLRWTRVDRSGSTVHRLDALRLDVLGALPSDRRSRVLGISREGVEQFGSEVRRIEVQARLLLARARHDVRAVPRELGDLFTLGSASWTILKILFVIATYMMIFRRSADIRAAFRRWFGLEGGGTGVGRRGAAVFTFLEGPAPWALFLAYLYVLRWWAAESFADRPEIDFAFKVAALYGFYRLSIDLIVDLAIVAVRRYGQSLASRSTSEYLRSARTLMRAVMGVAGLVTLSEDVMGRGYLFHLVVRFAWVVLAGVALILLNRWRTPIAEAYIRMHSQGRLTAVVRATRDRWYGVFVAAAAFVLLAVRGLATVTRDFVLGFDQSRKALAFLFRRKVEKRAEREGYAEGKIEDLPPEVLTAFSEEPVGEGNVALDYFPGFDKLLAMIEEWRESDTGASFLLAGEKGVGKTSWLGHIRPDGVPVARLTLGQRLLTPARLAHALSSGLEIDLKPDDGAGLPSIQKSLLAGPKRMVLVDLAQNLFLGCVGGYDTFEAFVGLVEATCGQVFWVCSMSAFSCDHLFAVRPDLMVFRHHEILPRWSEEQIGDLIRSRLAAGGIEVSFEDLVMREDGRRDLRDEGDRTRDEYTRLLWDYSDGNPRAALHFWLRSLVGDAAGRLRVRLFRPPASEELESLSEQSRFLLAAIVVHENLSLAEAVTVTRYHGATCRIQLERLESKGLLYREAGRYRLTSHWHRAILRFLRRTNLLSD